MVKLTILWLATATLISCGQTIEVEVRNTTQIDRNHETVEIVWSKLEEANITPQNVVVVDANGVQIPSQVLYLGTESPQSLIFQVEAKKMESKKFKIKTGIRDNYEQKAFGRQVPERLDDYAWENNFAAYRLYGPALETDKDQALVSQGIDVWCKSTEDMVIDKWYAKDNYHRNDGDGMDCYKVGPTLGGGASAPMVNGKLHLSRNYATQQRLDNGPIRTSVKLTYTPWCVDNIKVSLTKQISLDANHSLNRMTNIYTGAFDKLPIAAGFVRHQVKNVEKTDLWMAMCEEVSDSKDPIRDGDIYFAVAMQGSKMLPDTLGHTVAVREVGSYEELIYLAGGLWSQAGVENMKQWVEMVEQEAASLNAPLEVTIKN